MMDGRSQSRQSQVARCGWLCGVRLASAPRAGGCRNPTYRVEHRHDPQGSYIFFGRSRSGNGRGQPIRVSHQQRMTF
jgi:hypothetical protein